MPKSKLVIGVWSEWRGSSFRAGEGVCRVTSQIVAFLVEAGVPVVFGLHEDSLASTTATLRDHGCRTERICFITARDSPVARGAATFDRIFSRVDLAYWLCVRSLSHFSWFTPLSFLRRGEGAKSGLRLVSQYFQRVGQLYEVAATGATAPLHIVAGAFRLLRRTLNSLATSGGWEHRVADGFRSAGVEAAYVPFSGFVGATALSCPKVAAFWDFVFFEVPFFGWPVTHSLACHRRLLEHADSVIVNSDYVKDRHLVAHGLCPREKVTVARVPRFPTPKDEPAVKTPAGERLRGHCGNLYAQTCGFDSYLCDLPLGAIPFILCATQDRANKNLLNLIRAYEYLLRVKRRNLKLVITADLTDNRRLLDFLSKQCLSLDVIQLRCVPETVLDAMFASARLTVVPSFFEGGLPFNFEASLRHRKPVAMARIPVVQEILDDGSVDDVLFDPTSFMNMAYVIEHCLDHAENVVEREIRALERAYAGNSWDVYTKRLLDALTRAKDSHWRAP